MSMTPDPPAQPSSGRPGLAGYPVNLLVRGRRVVVVGGGRIAARKIEPLLDLGADVVVIGAAVGEEVRAWAGARWSCAPSVSTTSTACNSP